MGFHGIALLNFFSRIEGHYAQSIYSSGKLIARKITSKQVLTAMNEKKKEYKQKQNKNSAMLFIHITVGCFSYTPSLVLFLVLLLFSKQFTAASVHGTGRPFAFNRFFVSVYFLRKEHLLVNS